MSKYRVVIEAVASTVVEVEADTREDAIDEALSNYPRAAWDWPDMGEWYFPGDDNADHIDDYIEEVED